MYAMAAGNSILGASGTRRSIVSRQSSRTTPRNLISRNSALSKSHLACLISDKLYPVAARDGIRELLVAYGPTLTAFRRRGPGDDKPAGPNNHARGKR